MLKSFSPKDAAEFAAAMTVAYCWAQRRARFYPHVTELTLDEFIESQQAENKKQIGVLQDGQMCALITVWLMQDEIYDVHVIAPRKSKANILLAALLQVRNSLFDSQKARIIKTSCGTYRGHLHKGMKRLLEACEMTPIGDAWRFAGHDSATFQEYQITREDYVKSKKRIHE